MGKGDPSVQKLKERFPRAVLAEGEFRGETTVTINARDIVAICQFLRDDPELAYDLCLFVSAIDQRDM
ncbi:MAG: NADH-quinone oxidoreductase subunit C, partial [Anaerolineae bacterium]|nr:NADH-quinone oxidoreductase subunit C [Anaerolineae bacterium]